MFALCMYIEFGYVVGELTPLNCFCFYVAIFSIYNICECLYS
jgi:hypothetical protein